MYTSFLFYDKNVHTQKKKWYMEERSTEEMLCWDLVPVSLDDMHLNWLGRRGANYYHFDLFSFAAIA